MQTFAKSKMAVAVGASLLVLAGVAQAAGTNPTVRTAGIVATGMTAGQAQNLFSATGYAGPVAITVYLKPTADTVTAANSQAITDAGLLVNGQAGAGAGSANANNDFTVTYGATPVFFPVAGVAFTPNTAVGGTALVASGAAGAYASAAFTISGVAGDAHPAFRMNNGSLEYTPDNSIAAPVWSAVNVQGLTAGANPITATDSAGAPAVTFTSAAAPAVLGVAPTPVVSTHSSASVAGGAKIDGLTVNTFAPISALAKTTNFTVAAVACAAAPTIVNGKDITAGATGAVAANAQNTILFATPETVTWTANAATDAAAYNTQCFNTGVEGADVPFAASIVPGAGEPSYTNIFDPATGLATKLTSLPAPVLDGALPALVKAETYVIPASDPSISQLILTFSEPLSDINNGNSVGPVSDAGDLREIAENVKIGADTLAALNLNANGVLSAEMSVTAGGQSKLTISGILTADLAGKQVSVVQGISTKEANDSGYVAATAKLDNGFNALSGGLTTATTNNGDVVSDEFISAAATTTSALPLTIAFNSDDTSATAATTAADPAKIGQITVKFAAGKEVVLGTGKTMADLAADLVVTVKGFDNHDPVTWQFHPAAADIALSADGASLTIAIPTPLVYAHIDAGALTGMWVGYLNTAALNIPVADVLVSKAAASIVVTSIMADAFSGEPVTLPLSAMATSNDLLTQSISGTLANVSNGSLVHAYLAKWTEKSTTDDATVEIKAGKITNPGDKVATDLAIQYAAGQKAALEVLIANERNAVAVAEKAVAGVSNAVAAVKAQPIPVYVQLIRSSDTQGNTKGDQNYLEARAILSTVSDDAAFFASIPQNGLGNTTDVNPIYQVMLDPTTGAISGRLTGSLTLKSVPGSAIPAGLTVITEVAQGQVDAAGKFSLIAATDPSTADIAKGMSGLADKFLILVHEDQNAERRFTQLTSANSAATNYLPYAPNLYSLSGTRTYLGVNGIAAPLKAGAAAATATPIDLSKYKINELTRTNAWSLVSIVSPAGKLGNLARNFVGTDEVNGYPQSFWAAGDAFDGDGHTGDMALTMIGNKVGVATELASGDTLSTISDASFVSGAAALAFANDFYWFGPNSQVLSTAQAAAPAVVKVPAGWSLVAVPQSGVLNSATVEGVLRVGGQVASDTTWFKADGAMPTLTGGEALFVYSPKGGAL